MNDQQINYWKYYIVAALAVIASLIGVFSQCVQNYPTSVAPSPSPSLGVSPIPSPSLMPSPLPSPSTVASVAPSPTPSILIVSRGETLGLEITGQGTCKPISDSAALGITVTHFKRMPVTTTTPSANTLKAGAFLDALVPGVTQVCGGDSLYVDILVNSSTLPGDYQIQMAGALTWIHVGKGTLPVKPSLPLYSEITSNALLNAHKLPATTNVSVQGPLTLSYVQMLRAHRMEPIKQYVVYPSANADGTLNVDLYSAYQGSFRQLVVNGALAPIMIPTYFGPNNTDRPTLAYLQAAQNFITSSGLSAWTYAWDEPSSTAMTELKARIGLIRQYAPSLKIMVTTQADSTLDVDTFVPVMEWFNQTGHVLKSAYTNPYGLYGSCMAHGNCVNGTPGRLTGTPDLMMDDDPTNFMAYPLTIYASGASVGLYYNTTQAFGAQDPWVNQYLFAGNGDGTLFYPGRIGENGLTSNVPLPSYRMKLMRAGQNLVDYLTLTHSTQTVVTDAFHWSHTASDYEALRTQLAKSLDR